MRQLAKNSELHSTLGREFDPRYTSVVDVICKLVVAVISLLACADNRKRRPCQLDAFSEDDVF